MPSVPTLATPRFTLRPLRREDTTALFPTFADEAQCRFLTRPAFSSEEELAGWLFEPGWNGRTWIAEDAEGRVAGRFVAVPGLDDGVAEIGYVVCLDRQRAGVARECTSALVEQLIVQEGKRKLTAEVDAQNVASIRLLESLGFTREAFFREHEITHAGLRDVAVYGLLAPDLRR